MGHAIENRAAIAQRTVSRTPSLTPVASKYDASIVGLGALGTATASALVRRGKRVAGFDIDPDRVAEATSNGLPAFTGPACADVHLVCVPPGAIEAAVESVAAVLEPGNLILVATAVPPGTMRRVVAARCRAAGFEPGRDVFVAYIPDGAGFVGGVTEACADKGVEFATSFASSTPASTRAEIAELATLAERTFHDVNIAYANELENVCSAAGVDAAEVRELADAPIAAPGPAPLGHAAEMLADVAPHDAPLIGAAREVNDRRPARIVARVRSVARRFNSPRIAVLGLSDASAREVAKMLATERIGELMLCDPYLEASPLAEHPLVEAALAVASADIVVVLAALAPFRRLRPEAFGRPCVVDTAGLLRT